MDLMSALDNMSGDQFGGDTLQPSAVYSPEQPFGNDSDEDSRTSWTAHVTGVSPNSDGGPQPQPASGSGDTDTPGNGPAKSGVSAKFAKTDPYAIVGRVSTSLQKVRPSSGS